MIIFSCVPSGEVLRLVITNSYFKVMSVNDRINILWEEDGKRSTVLRKNIIPQPPESLSVGQQV